MNNTLARKLKNHNQPTYDDNSKYERDARRMARDVRKAVAENDWEIRHGKIAVQAFSNADSGSFDSRCFEEIFPLDLSSPKFRAFILLICGQSSQSPAIQRAVEILKSTEDWPVDELALWDARQDCPGVMGHA